MLSLYVKDASVIFFHYCLFSFCFVINITLYRSVICFLLLLLSVLFTFLMLFLSCYCDMIAIILLIVIIIFIMIYTFSSLNSIQIQIINTNGMKYTYRLRAKLVFPSVHSSIRGTSLAVSNFEKQGEEILRCDGCVYCECECVCVCVFMHVCMYM